MTWHFETQARLAVRRKLNARCKAVQPASHSVSQPVTQFVPNATDKERSDRPCQSYKRLVGGTGEITKQVNVGFVVDTTSLLDVCLREIWVFPYQCNCTYVP